MSHKSQLPRPAAEPVTVPHPQDQTVQPEHLRTQLLEVQEQERARLAKDIHGGPVQELSSILFQLNMMQQMGMDDGQREMIEPLKDSLKTAIAELRRYIHWLRPASLHHFGLQPALRTTTEQYQVQYPDIKFALIINSEDRPSSSVEVGLFRIFQQTLQNAVQHAAARNIMIRLLYQPDAIRLEIEDDGEGFNLTSECDALIRDGKLGLFIARQQALALGSSLDISTQPGEGTRVRISLPT